MHQVSELRRLRYFLAVADELNFSRASERLHIAQPALSRQIRLLEQELGVDLFARTTHEVTLTEAGAFLRERAPLTIGAFDDLWRATRGFGTGDQGSIAFAFGTSAGYETAPRLLEAIRDWNPHLQISSQVLPLDSILKGLTSGELDLGLIRCPPQTAELEDWLIRREPLGILMRASHAPGSGSSLSLGDIAQLPVLMHPRDANPGHYDALTSLFESDGFAPQVMLRDLPTDLAYLPIVEGRAVSIVGISVADSVPASLRWLPLEPEASIEIKLVTRRGTRPLAVDRLVRAATEIADDLGWLESPADELLPAMP